MNKFTLIALKRLYEPHRALKGQDIDVDSQTNKNTILFRKGMNENDSTSKRFN